MKILVRLVCIFILITIGSTQSIAQPLSVHAESQHTAWLAQEAPDQPIQAILRLKDAPEFSHSLQSKKPSSEKVVHDLKQHAAQTQKNILSELARMQNQNRISQVTPLWIINGIVVKGLPKDLVELAKRPEITAIYPDFTITPPTYIPPVSSPEPNINQIYAPSLWLLGYRGQDVVIAVMDTGVDGNHPDLAGSWRGGNNSWFDPNGQHTTPVDIAGPYSGHGTAVTGIILGDRTGVAPYAHWIAVKLFDDNGLSSISKIHLSYQWILDPDNNPTTPDAPQIVNNSWGFSATGCNLEFQPDLQALLASGILPVFSAGNSGPSPNTDSSPANYPEAFSVGSVSSNDQISSFSSRGASQCGSDVVFPTITAPGESIHTTLAGGESTYESGTSFAAPHVSGSLALLLSAFPTLSVSQQKDALICGSADFGPPGPDNNYGFGRLNVLASYHCLGGTGPTFNFLPLVSR